MNMLETKTDEQIPGMGDLITKQNTTKTWQTTNRLQEYYR